MSDSMSGVISDSAGSQQAAADRLATRRMIADLLIPEDRAFDRYVYINTRNDAVLLKYIHAFKAEGRRLDA